MAVQYSSRKCESCGGSLEYIREKKVWRCKYCGTEIIREATQDILYGIKNVVRQTIVDTAYRNVGSARDNLSECEKIDTNYVGTLLARICYRFLLAISPNESRAEELRSVYTRLKNDFSTLRSREDGIAEDEEEVYDFLASNDGGSDALAMLLIVFSNLGDSMRADYYFQLLDLAQVYSKQCNQDLLKYCLKTGREESARKIIANRECIDPHTAMDTVMDHCPDGEIKRELMASLVKQGAYNRDDRDKVRSYLSGGDSSATKAELLALSKGAGFLPDTGSVIQHVLTPASPEELDRALDGLCTSDLRDQDLYDVLGFALSQTPDKARIVMNKIAASGRFVALNSRILSQLFMNTAWSVDERISVWNAMQSFRIDERAMDTAASEYLLRGKDEPGDRGRILHVLMGAIRAVSPSVLERYLLECRLDGANKAGVITELFTMDNMRPALFGSALGKYLRSSPDDPQTTQRVLDALIAAGLTMEPRSITEFISAPGGDTAGKIEMLRRLEKNGCQAPADALSVYLERSGGSVSQAVVLFLFERATKVSDLALKNFILYSEDSGSVKVNSAEALATINGMSLGSSPCSVRCLGSEISCGLAQAYLLVGQDSIQTSAQMLQAMTRSFRITNDIKVNGAAYGMKKYMKENKAKLSPRAVQLGESYRLFSLF